MIETLPLFHRIAGQPVVVLGNGEAAAAKRRLVERAGGNVVDEIQQGIDTGARLAFVAHDNAEAASGDAIRLRCAGLLVNVTDQPELCDFLVPSVLDRAPVLIAVGTGGASAGLAKALRLRLETVLPHSLGRLAQALSGARGAMRARWPDASARRRALDDALADGGTLDVLGETSADKVAQWLDAANAGSKAEIVEIIVTGDDPDDLTLRQARLLGNADTIVGEAGIAPAILDRGRADAVRVTIGAGDAVIQSDGLTVVLRRQR